MRSRCGPFMRSQRPYLRNQFDLLKIQQIINWIQFYTYGSRMTITL